MQRATAASLAAVLSVALLAGCAEQPPSHSPPPPETPPSLAPPPPAAPSQRSEDLARYYGQIQRDLLAQGLLRTDGGGPDTPFTPEQLAENFEVIAFYDEYTRSGGVNRRGGTQVRLSRWPGPVRIGVEFGASVTQDERRKDQEAVSAYAARLARITGHPISAGRGLPNFHVFVAGEDDREFVQTRLKRLIPNISASELALFGNLPRSFYCLVVAVADPAAPDRYTRAVALIRAEQPWLMRLSCFHEEIAQGLGLPNDSPSARPSIFNDDDEFALLTNHDELLLMMLYDPRLKPGMTADEARPVVRIIARELMGQTL